MTPELKIELTERIKELLPTYEIFKVGDGTVLGVKGTEVYIDLNLAAYEHSRNELENYIKEVIK